MASVFSRLSRSVRDAALRRRLAASGGDVAQLASGQRMRVDPTTAFGQELLERGERESELFLAPMMQTLLRPGDVFLDVGAHWGTYSLAASSLVGKEGRVVSVEPHEPSLLRLKENLALNGCDNATAFHCAVSADAGRGTLRLGGSGDNLNRLTKASDASPGAWNELRSRFGLGRYRDVDTRPLGDILAAADVEGARLMKMDIEGGEWALPAALAEPLARIDVWLVELHPRWSSDAEEAAMYDCLAGGRELYVCDEEKRTLRPVKSKEQFLAELPLYYFASALPGQAPELRDFTW